MAAEEERRAIRDAVYIITIQYLIPLREGRIINALE